jgi:hypothetical protein
MSRLIDFPGTFGNGCEIGLENYLLYGYRPGSFLEAVLCNDLQSAWARADSVNKHSGLGAIVDFLRFDAPHNSWGSESLYKDWIADYEGRRTRFKEHTEKNFTLRSVGAKLNKYYYVTEV